MKNFRNVTAAVLAVIVLLFAGNIYFLTALYGSLKKQCVDTALECLMQADMIELVSRARRYHEITDTDLCITVPVELSRSLADAAGLTPGFRAGSIPKGSFQEFNVTLARGIRDAVVPYEKTGTDFALLDSVFRDELNRTGLFPGRVTVLPADSLPDAGDVSGMWRVDYALADGTPLIYHAYISPPFAHILAQMSGIIATTALIIAALVFIFVYLIRTVLRMRSLEDMKDDFTNNMTHELKTPIAIAYAANDTLLNCGAAADPVRRERYLRVALEQLGRLGGLVENILSMSMERRKTLVLARERVELLPFLRELAAAHSLRAEKKVDISIAVTPENLTLETDPTHFANMLNNFIDNAIKYSGPEVTVDIRADASGISVADNGIGISPRQLPLVFNKFYRVPHGNCQNVRGYGIGLYYVRSIAAKMGWTVQAESRPGRGSVFTLKFSSDNGR